MSDDDTVLRVKLRDQIQRLMAHAEEDERFPFVVVMVGRDLSNRDKPPYVTVAGTLEPASMLLALRAGMRHVIHYKDHGLRYLADEPDNMKDA